MRPINNTVSYQNYLRNRNRNQPAPPAQSGDDGSASAWASYNSPSSPPRDEGNGIVVSSSEAYSVGGAHLRRSARVRSNADNSDDSPRPRQRRRVEQAVGNHQPVRRPRRRRRPDPPRFDFVLNHEAEQRRIEQQRLERDERSRLRNERRELQLQMQEERRLQRLQQEQQQQERELEEQRRIERLQRQQDLLNDRRRFAANLVRNRVLRLNAQIAEMEHPDYIHDDESTLREQRLRADRNGALCPTIRPREVPTGTCPICLEQFEVVWEVLQTSICQHHFHKACLTQWLNTPGGSHCPLCRESVDINFQ